MASIIPTIGGAQAPPSKDIFVCEDENGRVGIWVMTADKKTPPGWCAGSSMQREEYYNEKAQQEYRERVKAAAKFQDDVEALRKK